jgi:hypoxanthine phosphoribosyltransferase
VAAIGLLFDAATIARRVDELAAELARAGPRDFLIVGLLKGSFVFLADLLRALQREGLAPQIEFMRLSSYGLEMTSAGEVHLISDIPINVSRRDVLLVDDIVDTGRSLAYAIALLEQRGVGSIRTCALLDKPSRREVDVPMDFVGFTIDDVFVAGYGIDYAERYRELPDIVIVALPPATGEAG